MAMSTTDSGATHSLLNTSEDAAALYLRGMAVCLTGAFDRALPLLSASARLLREQGRLRVLAQVLSIRAWAALEVADMIHARNLDTYVGRMCASACTIAFLAGHQRFATDTARLGFHQAHGPGLTPADSNLLLRLAYQNYSLPLAFIAHVLRTPPQDLWVPDLAELRKAGVVTDIAPTGAIAASVASGATDAHGN